MLGILLLQAAWIVTVPPFRGSDEVDHAYRAAAVARGEWVAGDYAQDGRGWLVTVPESLVDAAHGQCEALIYNGPDNCIPAADAGDGNVLVASSAASYHPAFYWFVGTAALPFDGTAALYAMRVAAALICLLFIGLGAWAAGRLPTRWPLAALAVAASPVLVYSTSITAPNGLEMSAALSLWLSLLAITHGQSLATEKRMIWVAIASAVVMGTLRLTGPLFILLVVATIFVLRPAELVAAIRRRWVLVTSGAVLVAASVANFAVWTFGPWALDGSDILAPEDQPSMRGSDLVLWPLQSIAAFPYRDQMGAAVVYPVVGGLVVALLVVASKRSGARDRTVMYLSLLGALTVPVALTVATMGDRGVIWQGRYGLPYAVGFVLIAGYLVGMRSSRDVPRRWVVPALCAYGVAIAACLIKVRGAELAHNPASAAGAAWHVPSPVLIVALAAAAMVAFVLTLSRRLDERA